MPNTDKSPAAPDKTGGKPEDHAPKDRRSERAAHKEHRLDEGLEETFPASDPVAAHHIT